MFVCFSLASLARVNLLCGMDIAVFVFWSKFVPTQEIASVLPVVPFVLLDRNLPVVPFKSMSFSKVVDLLLLSISCWELYSKALYVLCIPLHCAADHIVLFSKLFSLFFVSVMSSPWRRLFHSSTSRNFFLPIMAKHLPPIFMKAWGEMAGCIASDGISTLVYCTPLPWLGLCLHLAQKLPSPQQHGITLLLQGTSIRDFTSMSIELCVSASLLIREVRKHFIGLLQPMTFWVCLF